MENIKRTIEELIAKTGFDVDDLNFCDEVEGLWCQIKTPDSGLMIGPDGETLSAINHLVYRIIENKKIENLKTKAHMMAERARFFKSNIEIEPMPAGERRIIHQYLDGKPDIKTESTGVGKSRRIIIKYIANDSTI